MPELPEVEVIRLGLAPGLIGRRLLAIDCQRRDLRYPLPAGLRRLVGCSVTALERRGKYLLFFFDDLLLAWHLGMSGRLQLLSPQAPAGMHEHLRLDFSGDASLRYRDARRFGYVGLLPAADWQCHPWFCQLGVEPLTPAFDGAYLAECCLGRMAPIKQVLMDARIVAGVGNIYASESLFAAGIHPSRAAGRISGKRLVILAAAVKEVLTQAIAAGGSSIRDFIRADGRPGYFAHAFQVYGRAGQSCRRCGGSISRRQIGGRSSFYCPGCQH